MFHKVKVTRASEEIVKQIEEAIYSGQLNPGDRLPPERDLADRFGLSRMTIRDALRVLESTGLIEIKVGSGGGAFVREPNTDSFRNSITSVVRSGRASILELAEARNVIETATAELAARRATEEDLEVLRAAVAGAKKALKAGETHYMPHSVNFHTALANASKNTILQLTVDSFQTLFSSVLEELLPTRDMAERAAKDHAEIYRAIKSGDAARARKAMSKHLAYFEERVKEKDEDSEKEVKTVGLSLPS